MVKTIEITWNVLKRDGRIEELNKNNIKSAISKCFSSCEIVTTNVELDNIVDNVVEKIYGNGNPIHVEHVQDMVEATLLELQYVEAARAYIRYRDYKNTVREKRNVTAEDVNKVIGNKKYFENDLAEFVFYRSYSRWKEDANRRETWEETIERVVNYFRKRVEIS